MKKFMKKSNKGFSLVELIVVIAIMAVLVGVLAPQFTGYVTKAKKATDVQNAEVLAQEIAVGLTGADTITAVTRQESVTLTPMGGTSTTYGNVDSKSVSDQKLLISYTAAGVIKIELQTGTSTYVELYPTTTYAN